LALFLTGETPIPGDAYQPWTVAEGLDLEVPEGTNVAVLDTDNPDITVIWFF
jgi:hypothetical protein